MRLDVSQLAALGLVSAAGHWIVARSRIAEPLWSRASGLADDFLRCSGCVGFWIGILSGLLGLRPLTGSTIAVDVLLTGMLAVWLTPVFEGVLIWGRDRAAIPDKVKEKVGSENPDPNSDPKPAIPDLTSEVVSDRVPDPR